MSLLPPPGPQRTRQMVLLGILGVAVLVWAWQAAPWRAAQNPAVPPSAASNPQGAQPPRAGTQGKPAAVAAMPEPVNLPKLEPVPDEPGAGRNLFRFGVRPPPPAPPTPPPVQAPVVVAPPPQPTGPPPIDLQLKGITRAPDSPAIAWLKDPKAPDGSRLLSGVEGQIVDGKYKLIKIGTESVILSYVDGTGLRTIMIR